jgi:uncharacterized membrane protein
MYVLIIVILLIILFYFYSNITMEGFQQKYFVKPTDDMNEDRFIKVLNETPREEYKRVYTNIRSYQL